jgi:hypothetical protein
MFRKPLRFPKHTLLFKLFDAQDWRTLPKMAQPLLDCSYQFFYACVLQIPFFQQPNTNGHIAPNPFVNLPQYS